MQVPHYNPNRRYGFNMTPMIDVVFLLVIFFLVSSHLARQETQIQLQLPIALSGNEEEDQQTPRITINVQEDGSLWLAGRQIDKGQLAERLVAARSAHGDGIEVRIRGSRLAAYEVFEPIMLACTHAKIWNVTYAVYQEEAN